MNRATASAMSSIVSARGGWMLRPKPGRSGTQVAYRSASSAAVGRRYVPEMPKPWIWMIVRAPAGTGRAFVR